MVTDLNFDVCHMPNSDMLIINFLDILELLTELARREKSAGIYPEPELDLFMKVKIEWSSKAN